MHLSLPIELFPLLDTILFYADETRERDSKDINCYPPFVYSIFIIPLLVYNHRHTVNQINFLDLYDPCSISSTQLRSWSKSDVVIETIRLVCEGPNGIDTV